MSRQSVVEAVVGAAMRAMLDELAAAGVAVEMQVLTAFKGDAGGLTVVSSVAGRPVSAAHMASQALKGAISAGQACGCAGCRRRQPALIAAWVEMAEAVAPAADVTVGGVH